ncbi:MAG: methylated-DNA--[protein]-cysteine S-methyltransferase [Candidatus Riflebacteria bacterium]|nr:methylated-DNA--[protein]-cysteine S-methyltransferase [Candidatus Riflebacteria bacterium]
MNKSHGDRTIFVSRFSTPLGPMLAGAVNDGICLLEFIDRNVLTTQCNKLKSALHCDIRSGSHFHLVELNRQLQEYFQGCRADFNIPLVISGTEFQKLVWNELLKIPYASTRSYKQQAEAMGRAQAVRAVANANSNNHIAILIPCHRVIGQNGKLVGYGGGIWRKQFLLDLESHDVLSRSQFADGAEK